ALLAHPRLPPPPPLFPYTTLFRSYTLATSETPEMRNIRDNVVTLLMPVMNPDGLDLVVDWYRKHLGAPYETSRLPVLYHYYMGRSEEHTSELQSRENLVCRLLLEK